MVESLAAVQRYPSRRPLPSCLGREAWPASASNQPTRQQRSAWRRNLFRRKETAVQEQPTRLAPAPTEASAPREGPAGQLRQRWRQGQRPDVDAFLAQAEPLSLEQAVEVLRLDQRERWQIGERVPAEAYLEHYPALRAHPEAAVDLIYYEFFLRERCGEQPDLEEYCQRFPEHADVL